MKLRNLIYGSVMALGLSGIASADEVSENATKPAQRAGVSVREDKRDLFMDPKRFMRYLEDLVEDKGVPGIHGINTYSNVDWPQEPDYVVCHIKYMHPVNEGLLIKRLGNKKAEEFKKTPKWERIQRESYYSDREVESFLRFFNDEFGKYDLWSEAVTVEGVKKKKSRSRFSLGNLFSKLVNKPTFIDSLESEGVIRVRPAERDRTYKARERNAFNYNYGAFEEKAENEFLEIVTNPEYNDKKVVFLLFGSGHNWVNNIAPIRYTRSRFKPWNVKNPDKSIRLIEIWPSHAWHKSYLPKYGQREDWKHSADPCKCDICSKTNDYKNMELENSNKKNKGKK